MLVLLRGMGQPGAGWLTFEDSVRSEAAAAVEPVARRIGIDDWRGACTPETKVAALHSMRRKVRGRVAAVGDGLNDGPLLAAADVGIALGSATDLASEAADVVLPPDGLVQLPRVLHLARRVGRTVVGNLGWAFGYNLVALGLAAAGLLQPVFAAALMAGSSLLVVLNSLRLERTAAHVDPRRSPGGSPVGVTTPSITEPISAP